MSNRPKWMPNEWLVNRAAFKSPRDCDELIMDAGLRAQIAAFEESAKLACYGCRNEEPTVEVMGAIYHLSGHLRARESCGSQAINERIAALRKELGE